MTTYDFTGLTHAQQEVLTFAGWHMGCGRVQPRTKTVQKLLDRGLVVRRLVSDDQGVLAFDVAEYDVPMEVHAAWCAHCASKEAKHG